MTEVFSSPFADIRTDPDAVQILGGSPNLTVVDHVFAGGFTFPYYGQTYSSVRVSPDGYISFDPSTVSVTDNTRLPSSTNARVHIAAFWDALHTRSSGQVHALHAADGSYIFQWSHVSKRVGSSDTNEYDLNFQIVLFPTGSFQFRYGTMDPPPTGSGSCYPTSDCAGDANGASATIGYQDPTGTYGNLVHFGGGTQDASNRPFPGGLANRTFRMDATQLSGSWTYVFGRDEWASICALLGGYMECEDVRILPLLPGAFLLSEIMLAPAAGEAQWFELKNLGPESIELEGAEIVVGGTSHPIGQSLVLPPFGFVTVAAGSPTSFDADLVVPSLTLPTPTGALAIEMDGTTLARIAWDDTWPIASGKSLELGSNAFRPSRYDLDAPTDFCLRTEAYDAGANAGTPGWDGGSCKPGQPYVAYTFTDAPHFDIGSSPPLITAIMVDTYVDLGFAFPYFGANATGIWVTSSGFLTMQDAEDEFDNEMLPSTHPSAMAGLIAPFWDDFSYSRHNATVKFAERVVDGQRVAIVDWDRVAPWNASNGNHVSFQAQLWEDGRIVFAYRNFVGSDPLITGTSATIGLQAPGADPAYFLFAYHEAAVVDGMTIEFVPVGAP